MIQDLIHIKIGNISPLYSLFFCVDSAQPFLSLVVEIVDAANKHMSNGGRERGRRRGRKGREKEEGGAGSKPTKLKARIQCSFFIEIIPRYDNLFA